ncbi:uncharacterized protein MONOS_13767 [Monocercomonoides exilis]|uniref:uncharacterized protein n=1 Tax=Monocercomonoides exilis TaxID=2049356 RepID=UPI00355A8C4F|nr:hypothetical protein MONOS_13767 [Monocercomonoides exilis]|eukprot:MONOS_13767.1-p1 / transcript=MONOS_13767.1 / gene=MONOS_13767 / organism=Monocercomonoides_exilis_PA203 / gene_product=unspecified product / transcript_product=unspecified product / location=Mono_scaffold00879:18560-19066(-) / protein_length=169 / sequence_SO=supercontig / SO=protein_coding / is_pseudo=false
MLFTSASEKILLHPDFVPIETATTEVELPAEQKASPKAPHNRHIRHPHTTQPAAPHHIPAASVAPSETTICDFHTFQPPQAPQYVAASRCCPSLFQTCLKPPPPTHPKGKLHVQMKMLITVHHLPPTSLRFYTSGVKMQTGVLLHIRLMKKMRKIVFDLEEEEVDEEE